MLDEPEAGPLQPGRHVLGGDAEAAMGVALTQVLEIMGSEVDDQHAAPRPEDAGGFGERPGGLVQIMKNLVDRYEIT